jgi:hypothetical protein
MSKFYLLILLSLATNLIQAQWQTDTRLTNAADESVFPSVAAGGKTVHVVWFDHRDGNNEIYYKGSANGGTTWGSDIRLTNDAALSYNPAVAISGSKVHVVWQDKRDGNDEIYYKQSTDGGITWGTDVRLTSNDSLSSNPCIAAFGLVVHVIWYDYRDGNTEIYYKRSADGGLTWGSDTRMTNDADQSFNPSIAISGSTVHVFWTDHRAGNNEIYYKRSTDGGLGWGVDTRLTTDPANSDYPMASASGLNVHVVWQDYRDGNYEIYYKRSKNGGLSWEADKRLTNNISAQFYPTITAAGTAVHVFWQDIRDGNNEIYYSHSIDTGSTWTTDARLTNEPLNSRKPAAVVCSSGLHLVWYDDRDGNNEIYYKRDTTAKATGISPVARSGDNNINIYPNPASNTVRIYSGNVSSESTIIIRNVLGEELIRKEGPDKETMIDVSALKNGIYFVSLLSEENAVENIKLYIAR